MASALYALGKQAMLNAEIDWDTDTLKVALLSSAYTPNLSTDQFYSGISANVLGTPQALASRTITGGVFDAADITYTAVTAGATAKAVVIYKDTGNPATSKVLAYIDSLTGFPMATNGGDITIQWDNGALKIFSL